MIATLWLVPLLVVGQATVADDDMAASVRRLVRQLDARELAQRDAAEQQLLELGTAALDHLPEIDERTSAETKQRLGRVRLRLERQHAATQAEASKVTLEGTMTLAEVLEAIREQTGNELLDYRRQFGQTAHDPELELDLHQVPFWSALDRVLDLAQLTVYPYARQGGVALISRTDDTASRQVAVAYVDAFRIQPLELIAQRDLTVVDQRSLRVRLEVAWEPRLRPIALTYAVDNIEAETDDGQDLSPAPSPGEIEASLTPGAQTTTLELVLQPADRTAERIARLSGRLTALLPGRTEVFRFDKLAEASGTERQQSGTVVRLEQVRRNNQLWEIRVRVGLEDPQQSLESHRDWMYHNEARLEGPDGEALQPDGLEVTLQTETAFGMAYLFDLPGDLTGYTFTYKTPGVMLSQPIEFVLRDLELP